MDNQAHHEENQEDHEQDFRDSSRGKCHEAETQSARHESNHQKD